MAKPSRPVSESYAPVCCSVGHSLSNSSETGIVLQDDDVDDDGEQLPIFSISKSSMDVVMATGHPHERDPAWTRLKIRRSSSTNTHSEPDAVILQQLRVHARPGVRSTNSQDSVIRPTPDVRGPPLPGEAEPPNEQSWSDCSGRSVLGRVAQKGRSSRPTSLTPEVCHSPSATPSPLQRPAVAGVDFSNLNLQEDSVGSSPDTTPPLSPLQSSRRQDGRFLEKHLLENKAASDVGRLVDDTEGPPLLDNTEEESLERQCCCSEGPSSADRPGSGGNAASVCYLELPQHSTESCDAPGDEEKNNSRSHGVCCRCSHSCSNVVPKSPRVRLFREEGTMTSQRKLVNAEVQTISPVGSWWDLRRNISTCSVESHSILGSPPGSRLNLRYSVGSHSNLVSPSSSMFKISSVEEEQRHGEEHQERKRRSCLKDKDDLGRRSSMKQVQWDEDGLTWDIHGASVDPVVLSTAIQRHLELKNSPDPPLRKSSKKTKAPKPPLTSSSAKTKNPELKAESIMINTSFCVIDSGAGADRGGGEEEGTADVPCRVSRAEGGNVKEEEEEVYSSQSQRRSVMRSVSGWCGGCRREKH